MSTQEKVFGLIQPRGKRSRPARIGMHPLHEAAMRLADLGFSRSRSKPKDLVGLLLCHGARALRSSQPRASMRIHTVTPVGYAAVKIRFK